jgi:outer membrane lipoprotein-sorting protein
MRRSRFVACLSVAWLLASGMATPAHAISAEEVVSRNVQARGGAAALAALSSLRRSGHLVPAGSSQLITLTDLRERPGRVRSEVTFQGLTQIVAFDGSKAWQVQPFVGRKDPAAMSDDETKSLRLSADLDGAWVDAQAKGHTIEYLGTEEIDGTAAHKLRVHLKWGDDLTVWFDSDTWMVMRDLQKTVVRGAEQETETDYGDYEKVGGVYVPMSEESGPRNSASSAKTKFVWEKAEGNIAVSADAFSMPQAAASAGATR